MFSTPSKIEIIIRATFIMSSANVFNLVTSKILSLGRVNPFSNTPFSVHPKFRGCRRQLKCDYQPFPKRQILDSSNPKELADDNFKFVENGRKLSKRVENTVAKGEIARYEQFLLFPQCFQESCTADT